VTLTVEAGDDVAEERPSFLHRAWRLPLWAHALALAVVLAALLPVMSPRSAFTSDEGAYALQVAALENGSWAYDYQAGRFDPAGDNFPIILSDRGPGGDSHFFTYVKHPSWPLLLRGTTAALGDTVGLHVLGLLGVLAVAVAAWLVAGELEPRLRRPAFWLAAGSPVLVNGFAIWAHAPSASLAGLALVAAARIVRRGPTPGAVAGAAAALVGGVLLRSEGLLFAGALALALAVVCRRTVGWTRAVGVFGCLAVPAVAAAILERRWVEGIVGGPTQPLAVRQTGSSSFLDGRVRGAWHELFQGHFSESSAALPVLAGLLLVVVLGFLALRRWGPRSRLLLAGGAVGAGLLLVLRMSAHPHEVVTGLLPAWPVAVLGVLLVRWRGAVPVIRLLGATVALFVAAIVATQYPEGGGLEWGGRFLSPVVVGLAVLAAAGLVRALDEVPRPDRRQATALVAVVGLAWAGFGLATAGALRAREDAIVAALARHPGQVVVTTRPAYPRLAWRAGDRLAWMLTDTAGLPALVTDLRDQGVTDMVLVVPATDDLAGLDGFRSVTEEKEPALADDGMKVVVLRAG
jgi:hypothetical protein